jgi:hypothetical protein
MRICVLISGLAFASNAVAQTFPGQEAKSMAPVHSGTDTPTSVRQPTPSRHQFSPGAMPIQIEGSGLAMPAGVDRDSPPPAPPAAPTTAKPPAIEK